MLSPHADDTPVEAVVQHEFLSNVETYLPGAIACIAPRVEGHIPDGFVRLDGEVLPVEVKRRRFTPLGRDQLLRYMAAYGASRGIAVAPELACDLPASITFVKVVAAEVLA